jgi:acyl-CoA thioester hydrolase
MPGNETQVAFRVRYCETDQMGTFSNARALEWFEVGRTEHLRRLGQPYAEMERKGVLLPVVEAHVQYLGRARYDDELRMRISCRMVGKARVRFDIDIDHADEKAHVANGYTVHAIVDASGKPARPPAWFTQAVGEPSLAPTDKARLTDKTSPSRS